MKKHLLLITVLTAFCGHAHSMLFSQIVTIQQGGIYKNFVLMTSLVIFAMGTGAWFSQNVKKTMTKLLVLELILLFICLISYFCFYFELLNFEMSLVLIGCIGLLCGAEMPFVYDIFIPSKAETHFAEKVLLSDYLGMTISAFLFSGVLLRFLGLLPSVFIVLAINLFIVLYLLALNRFGMRSWKS